VLAFTFPGQGSQRPGMGSPWSSHPSFELVHEASEVLRRDVQRLVVEADAAELTATANAQLAVFVTSLVALDAVERLGLAPVVVAGHSLGEYTALVAAGALSFEDGLRLVAERGEAMHHASLERPGTMAALVGIDDADAEAACARAEEEVWVANYNAPGQVVVAGTAEGVARAGALARELGAKRVMPLKVAGAFHTPLMEPARPRLRKALAEAAFEDCEVPVVANVDARVHRSAVEWRGLLSAQLCSPVRWRQTLEQLPRLGATAVVELGPGGVLTGLARRAASELDALAVGQPEDLDALVEAASGGGITARQPAEGRGEHLFTTERLVVAPRAGVFTPAAGLAAPSRAELGALPAPPRPAGARPNPGGVAILGPPERPLVAVGQVIGRVGSADVLSPFAGRLMGFLAHPGERVAAGQPVAWLRVEDPWT
jgi:[acyl-carrier-protein] S-malonyltransferase